MGSHRSLFEAQSTLENFVDRIILPNMVMRSKSRNSFRAEDKGTDVSFLSIAHEEEMFEDDPLEYIRQDLEPSTGESPLAGIYITP